MVGGNDSGAGDSYSCGGGGGAGGVGGTASNLTFGGGAGGLGIQLPATFRDPVSTVGAPGPTTPSVTGADTSGKYYVAGGGGGGVYSQDPAETPAGYQPGPKGGGVGGPFAGAGNGGSAPTAPFASASTNALSNTGSGGGGARTDETNGTGGNGGSGIVLIAYPS